ncbi:MAG: right-handed parallel beta-helix repeat-containing protein, partial [Pyrobaculum aerophilum]
MFASPKAILYNCKVYQNGANGMFIKNSPEVKIEDCDIYDNGSSSNDYPQIWIEASKVWIENSKIWTKANSSKTSTGIHITASPKAILKNCKIYQNNRYGVNIENSPEVKIEDCDIYDNGSSSFLNSYPQIGIEASNVWIENSKVWMETKNIKNHGIY